MEQKQLSHEGEARESERSDATFIRKVTKYCKANVLKVLYFVTLNPYKKGKQFKRLQKIGPVYDLLRKRFTNIFIVQETNPDGTKHYHAIAVGPAELSLWDPKGVKVHIQRVGGPVARHYDPPEPCSFPDPTPEERAEDFLRESLEEEMSKHHHLFTVTLHYLSCVCRYQFKKRRAHKASVQRLNRKVRIGGDLGRIVNYMTKEIGHEPEEYVHYILSSR